MSYTRLYQDRWLIQNSLPYVIPYLEVEDLLKLSNTCELWNSVLQEFYFSKTFIPTCYDHKDKLFEYGAEIQRLQLTDIKFQNILKVTLVNLRLESYPTEISLASNQQTAITKTFLENFENLTHFRFYTSWRLIFIERRNNNNDEFYWKSLINTKLTYLDLSFHIPANFGRKVLKYLRNLEVLKLQFYSGIDEHLFESISDLNGLKKLAILKVEVNDDMCQFLPKCLSLEELTILIRAPCDTNYTILLRNVAKLSLGLKKFRWVLTEVTMSDAFFGENCQTFLEVNTAESFNKDVLKKLLKKHLPNTKIIIEFDYEFPLGIRKHFKKCFNCPEKTAYVSSYDFGIANKEK